MRQPTLSICSDEYGTYNIPLPAGTTTENNQRLECLGGGASIRSCTHKVINDMVGGRRTDLLGVQSAFAADTSAVGKASGRAARPKLRSARRAVKKILRKKLRVGGIKFFMREFRQKTKEGIQREHKYP